ncbi:serine hydrolase [Actinomadura macrotermitis]|nr:serine hydrolase [Actinomadura macrotermitis]
MPRRHSRTALTALLAGAALVPVVPAAQAAPVAAPVTARAAAANPCTSERNPRTAAALGKAVTAALAGRRGTESVAVYDRRRGIYCAVGSTRRYDSASVVKATILAGLLRKVTDAKRTMTAREKTLATKMITKSDNAAASTLWREVGRTRLQRLLNDAGMTRTVLGPGKYWGLTQITAHDQIKLLRLLTAPNKVLSDKARGYELKLMGQVVSSQRWGTPAGHPQGVAWHVKNGWLPRHGKAWRVHSIGAFDGRDRDYMMVVLTQDTPSMGYAVTTIERVARAVHRDLNPGLRVTTTETVPAQVPETSDGSVPPNV